MTDKNIVWLKDIFIINIKTIIHWIDLDQSEITCQSRYQVIDHDNPINKPNYKAQFLINPISKDKLKKK